MPALEPTDFNGQTAVDSYGPGFFRVAGQIFHGPVIVQAQGVTPWAGLDDLATLQALAGRVDVLFLGMGAATAPIPRDLLDQLDAAGLRAEAMTSPTAARTYNVTLSEGRRVACALLPL
ncbi:Mth938-like domain-containing protein [Paracoccus nototheniae]|uniref:Mth938-like domain-containing protein n=1 Tax=Paracoccus nototheniae TaxID=2489002 RepID=A0ABW4E1P9_9RHOB|nr:Mth938-like domain-containing protein [Paracoccus nototheniae]